jgi:hypothetical protein
MSSLGFTVDFRKGDEFRALIARDHQKYRAIIHDAGIQPE